MVYTLPNGAVFTYHDNSNLMGRKLGLRVRQPHGLAKDVGAAGFFGVEARSSGFGGAAANATMYVAEKMHLAPFSSLLGDAVPRAFLSGAADLPERGKQDFIFWAGDEGTAAHLTLTLTLTQTLTLTLTRTRTLTCPAVDGSRAP